MDLDDDSWVFEKKCGAKYDSCFRKVTALCSTHDDECRNATNFTEDKVRSYVLFEPVREKLTIWVSDQVRHKPGCTATEDC